jgi:hypothetical protein
MIFSRRILILIAFFSCCLATANGQDKPIGYWESYLPYNSALGVATDGSTLFTVGKQAFFTYHPGTSQTDVFSKVEGMSDIGMQAVGYDMATATAILVYANGNIDLYKNNTFYNVPDLKLKIIAGSKTVYSVYTLNGYAYLSTAIGVIVIDMTSHTVKESYQFNLNNQLIPVKSFTAAGSYFYAVTTNGVYRVKQDNPQLQNYQVWSLMDTEHTYTNICNVNETIFLSTANTVFKVVDTVADTFYRSPVTITHIDAGYTSLFISEYIDSFYTGRVRIVDPVTALADTIRFVGHPNQVVQMMDSTVWVAEGFGGLLKRTGPATLSYFTPPGPLDANSFDIYARNNDLWVAHGGYNDRYEASGNYADLANLHDGRWTYYAPNIYHPFDTVNDVVVFTKDESDGTMYVGSYTDGLFIIKANGAYQQINNNSIFDPSQQLAYGSGRQIVGLALDTHRNLWVSIISAVHQLYVKTPDSLWYRFSVPNVSTGGPIVVDDNDQVWFVSAHGLGVTVYNYNGTISDQSDDASYHLGTGVGFGNLPSNTVFCMAKDHNNNIWIGTANGIGIVNSCHPSQGQATNCDAEIPIVQYDKYAGYLFAGQNVRSIAVDGANRKWVGTDDGVWLLSSDAGKIVYRFTVDNSPLPSNHIEKISIDPATGQVYIGTDQGLVSYRSTATEGGTANESVLTFPNPVPSGYTGTIAIKGLAANADIRITDIAGQLVYKTKAFGGQAVWSGLDYTGHRPQSGVYLIFVSSADGTATYTGKMVFLN